MNSWMRDPYITRNGLNDGFNETQRGSPNGTSIIPLRSYAQNNFIINGHNGLFGIDRDDGSKFVNDTHNFMVWGGCKSWVGHSKPCDRECALHAPPLLSVAMLADCRWLFGRQRDRLSRLAKASRHCLRWFYVPNLHQWQLCEHVLSRQRLYQRERCVLECISLQQQVAQRHHL